MTSIAAQGSDEAEHEIAIVVQRLIQAALMPRCVSRPANRVRVNGRQGLVEVLQAA
jgi:hypothetical protein